MKLVEKDLLRIIINFKALALGILISILPTLIIIIALLILLLNEMMVKLLLFD